MTSCSFFAMPGMSTTTNSPAGHLAVIVGPMFSGKSQELQRRTKRLRIAGKKTLVVNHASDTRYGDGAVISHDQQKMEACMWQALVPHLSECLAYDVIAIDEGQFFPDLFAGVKSLVVDHHKTVIVASLDGDFKGELFGEAYKLLPLSNEFVKLVAVCSICGADAPFTIRHKGDITDTTVVGSTELYMATCRSCKNSIVIVNKLN